MANNRLYIVDMETGERILLAKSLGHGWYIAPTWAEQKFNEWVSGRDLTASYGNCCGEPTKLKLEVE